MTTNYYIHSVFNDKFYIIEISFYRIQYNRKSMSLLRTSTVLIRFIQRWTRQGRYIAKTNIQVAKNKYLLYLA